MVCLWFACGFGESGVNGISDKVLTGTIGELLVQIRLLQFGVQAAPPIKDSGNDLIAVAGRVFRAVSVRTTSTGSYNKPPADRDYHLLAVVNLVGEGRRIHLDASEIFLVPRGDVPMASTVCANLGAYRLSRALTEQHFGPLLVD